ncbi:MAG: acetyl-CoA hydrolase, partial [Proteobacteria bacterium]|nr:acetyl-CoA hydrolase [Pseudomonadota bacterium]
MTRANTATRRFDNADDAVSVILERGGEHVICATPLGLGKPVALLNALYRRIREDRHRKLTIVTALSLAVPSAGSELERRFLAPFARRMFEGVPALDYLADLSRQQVPANIEILEFYFRPGSMLSNPAAQQNYISANYTHVARDVVDLGCNAVLVMVSEREGRYSLSCNPDLAFDVVRMVRERGETMTVVALVNRQLPFMSNDAEVGPEFFDVIVDAPEFETRLFSVPNSPAVPADHAVGLYAASLVKDGGTLQLGIGSLGDAVAHWLRARHMHPEDVSRIADALGLHRYRGLIDTQGGVEGFERGLFAASEMFTWSLMELYRSGVLKRRVYENALLQDALNRGIIEETFGSDVLTKLHAGGVISDPLQARDIEWLAYFGILGQPVPVGTGIRDVPSSALGRELQRGQV